MNRALDKFTKHMHNFVLVERQTIAMIGLLLLLLVATYSISLHFKPAQCDDLRLLTSVSDTANPLSYFGKDAGEGKTEYRPLLSIPLWFVYKVFGVRASVNQLVNLIFHFINVLLLLRIMRRVQTDNVLLFLIAAIFMVSINTFSPATWVADRPTTLVGLFLLLMIDYLLLVDQEKIHIRLSYVAIASFLALMSKESGLIVPIFVFFASVCAPVNSRMRTKIFMVSAIVLISYLGLRFVAFSSQPTSFVDIGYGPGIIYDNWITAISPEFKIRESVLTVMANLTAPFLPIFNWEGKVLPSGDLVKTMYIWVPTFFIFVLSYNLKLTTLQKYALIVVIANSLIHCVAFRYRIQYLSWIGACLFIAGSSTIKNSVNKKILVITVTSFLLFASLYAINKQLHHDWLRRYEAINNDELCREVYDCRLFGRIDEKIVQQILNTYKGDKD